MSSGDCSRALAQQSQMNGLRQLRDATGGHQVGWKSPTVDDDETASQQHGEESYVSYSLYLPSLLLTGNISIHF